MRTASQIKESFAELECSDRLLLCQTAMIQYCNRWVAAYRGEVVAVGSDLIEIREQLEQSKIPLATVAIRFIEADGMAAA